jgi:hypothetical protein
MLKKRLPLTLRQGSRLQAEAFAHRPALAAHSACMRMKTMKRLILTGAVFVALTTIAFGDGMFWVVGSHATNRCEVVTSNPVVDGGNIWFADGPYKSRDDAKLARSTITACPKVEPDKDASDKK